MTHEFATIKNQLRALLRERSVFHGDFTLASGAKSNVYVDCRLTTLHPEGAWLIGQVMRHLIVEQQKAMGVAVRSTGGLTMGADPIALAVAMISHWAKDTPAIQAFTVRKAPKAHGQTKRIEGCFQPGDTVAVIDDVITKGDSTLNAIDALVAEGAKVAFAAVLVDRQEGGRQRIEERGIPVVAAFARGEILE